MPPTPRYTSPAESHSPDKRPDSHAEHHLGLSLLELYEYKVADLLAGRTPRGNRAALKALRHTLLSTASDFPAAWQRRLRQTDRAYRQWTAAFGEPVNPEGMNSADNQPTGDQPTENHLAADLPSLPGSPSAGGTPKSQEVDQQEAAVWLRLQMLAWSKGTRQRLHQLTQHWRQEPGRPSLRVFYAALENAERRLRGVAEPFAVPSAADPLVSLGQQDIVHDLTESFADLLATPQGRAQLRLSLQEVRREPFPATSAAPAYPHAPPERPQLRETAAHLLHLLDTLLTDLPQPTQAQHILYAPTSPLLSANETSPELTLYLGAEVQEAYWQGLRIRWQAAGKNWQVLLGRQLLMLYPHLAAQERHASLKLRPSAAASVGLSPSTGPSTGSGAGPEMSEASSNDGSLEVEAYYEGDYLLLRRRGGAQTPQGPLQALEPLAAQARALAVMLAPEDDYAALRLARAADQDLRGLNLNLAALSTQSAERFRQASPPTLQQFAREGLRKLMAHLAEHSPAQTRDSLLRCAAALELPPHTALKLHEALHNALYPSEAVPPPAAQTSQQTRRLSPTGLFQTFELSQHEASGAQPLSLSVLGRVMTLRRNYQGEVIFSVPGYAAMTVGDALALPLGDIDLLLACHDGLVAVAALPRQIEMGAGNFADGAFVVED